MWIPWASILISKKFLVRDPGLVDVLGVDLNLKKFFVRDPGHVDVLGVIFDLKDLTGGLFGDFLVLFF